MHEFRADLHCHTVCSDGSLTPEEVIRLAATQGLKGLAITDHDTIDAYRSALPYAAQAGIELVTGVEFSTFHRGTSVHILAYSFSPSSKPIQELCNEHQQRREKRTAQMLALLSKHGMPIKEEELYAGRNSTSSIGRPHLAMAMVAKGYVKDLNEAFKKYLGEGKPCYAVGQPILIEDTLACIRAANAYAVMAHPHLVEQKVVKSLLAMPFDGLECFYARFTIEQNKHWIAAATEKGWLMTGGSDFHGAAKPAIPLGASWTREETFRILQERFQFNCSQGV